jgi:hypothetical protein
MEPGVAGYGRGGLALGRAVASAPGPGENSAARGAVQSIVWLRQFSDGTLSDGADSIIYPKDRKV